MHPALRVLAWFWSVVAVAVVCLVILLEALGPVPAPVYMPARVTGEAMPVRLDGATGPVPRLAAEPPPAQPAIANAQTGLDHTVHIRAPDPALLRADPALPGHPLPTPAGDRLPMQVYARPFTDDRRPRVAILVDGLGLTDIDSLDAIQRLPGPVDLAFSAYSPKPGPLVDAARSFGHEFLLSVPMEPQNYPQDDEGFRSLLVAADPATNARNLDWALSRLQGYVGATAAADGLRGERFAASGGPYANALTQIAADGLLYVDPRPSARLPTAVPGRSVDVVIDEATSAAEIDARLGALELIAKQKGSAVGLAGPLRPLIIERIALWAPGLAARGIALAPISALVARPTSTVNR